ncbi:Phytochelatin-domain-containing protein [Rhizoclosmatium globosum]|uniref:glutathione gamma-glutamylcysteinyltransferase n=1 Tax=Rhizoclosmatium globosum TaxID=329046 RepID=A0A1Y2CPJ2_9FUNG|nr:Phytochelatin-domain-containing protein [Rhizoclosmatium globosum]|eukprot:ORY48887.1 Phytochelatin-domain-containing protein [Rhizoclosmatium globosum]
MIALRSSCSRLFSTSCRSRQASPLCAATQLHSLPPPPSTFYRRNLPPILTSFSSPDGKKLLKDCLRLGTAESFLQLSGNLTHQSEPSFCGLGSLAIVLNALEVDPQRAWKGAWRWYDETTLLSCSRSVESVRQSGITFDQFSSLASSNGLNVSGKRIQSSSHTLTTKQEFINDLRRVCSGSGEQMVVSFCRKMLGQTGDGHFSPVGCFHEETGMVLVLDVARFKYPSYFVHVDVLYEAMKPADKATGKSRGYFVLGKKEEAVEERGSLLGAIQGHLNGCLFHQHSEGDMCCV